MDSCSEKNTFASNHYQIASGMDLVKSINYG